MITDWPKKIHFFQKFKTVKENKWYLWWQGPNWTLNFAFFSKKLTWKLIIIVCCSLEIININSLVEKIVDYLFTKVLTSIVKLWVYSITYMIIKLSISKSQVVPSIWKSLHTFIDRSIDFFMSAYVATYAKISFKV